MICPSCKKDVKELPGKISDCPDCGTLKHNEDGTSEPCERPKEISPAKLEEVEPNEPPKEKAAAQSSENLKRGFTLHIDFEDE